MARIDQHLCSKAEQKAASMSLRGDHDVHLHLSGYRSIARELDEFEATGRRGYWMETAGYTPKRLQELFERDTRQLIALVYGNNEKWKFVK